MATSPQVSDKTQFCEEGLLQSYQNADRIDLMGCLTGVGSAGPDGPTSSPSGLSRGSSVGSIAAAGIVIGGLAVFYSLYRTTNIFRWLGKRAKPRSPWEAASMVPSQYPSLPAAVRPQLGAWSMLIPQTLWKHAPGLLACKTCRLVFLQRSLQLGTQMCPQRSRLHCGR